MPHIEAFQCFFLFDTVSTKTANLLRINRCSIDLFRNSFGHRGHASAGGYTDRYEDGGSAEDKDC
jgi:hypothetical protein